MLQPNVMSTVYIMVLTGEFLFPWSSRLKILNVLFNGLLGFGHVTIYLHSPSAHGVLYGAAAVCPGVGQPQGWLRCLRTSCDRSSSCSLDSLNFIRGKFPREAIIALRLLEVKSYRLSCHWSGLFAMHGLVFQLCVWSYGMSSTKVMPDKCVGGRGGLFQRLLSLYWAIWTHLLLFKIAHALCCMGLI